MKMEKDKTQNKVYGEITAILLDVKNSNKIMKTTKTANDGSYVFSELEKGDYLVIFKYDTNNYHTTEYKKNGVDSTLNSDAVTKQVTLNGVKESVGVIEIKSLETEISNMDIGLAQNKDFNLKINKSIEKVTVKTKNETKQYNYKNEKLAKIEIKAKEIEGADLTIQYKITITNEGDISATVRKVKDYLPEGLKFSSVNNQNWNMEQNGELVNSSLSNKEIKPGESVSLTLIATKTMNENETGTYTNRAEIAEITNDYNLQVDNKEDTAGIIISISTGGIIIGIIGIFIACFIIAIITYIMRKHGMKKINKKALFVLILMITLFLQKITVLAYDFSSKGEVHNSILDENKAIGTTPPYPAAQRERYFWNIVDSLGIQTDYFSGSRGSRNIVGECIEAGAWGYSGWYVINGNSRELTSGSYYSNLQTMSLAGNTNSTMQMKTLDSSNYIYGPFSITSVTSGSSFSCSVLDSSGRGIYNYSICDAYGRSKTITGTGTFYIKIPASQCRNGISKVTVQATKRVSQQITYWKAGYAQYDSYGEVYHYDDEQRPGIFQQGWINIYTGQLVTGNAAYDCQKVETTELTTYWQKIENTTVTISAQLQWTSFNGSIEIIKQDSKTAKRLPNVTINISGIGNRTTDSNGRIYIENITSNRVYSITETSTPHYGYYAEARTSQTLRKGALLTITLNNIKHVGDLKIVKKDNDNSNVTLPDVTFKIRSSNGYIIAVDTGRSNEDKRNRKCNTWKPKIHKQHKPSNRIQNKQ